MTKEWPRILSRRIQTISPWMNIIVREVEFSPGEPAQTYHAVGQQDYVTIVARTPDGGIPVVRQYRPAVEAFTWELPSGLVDRGEEPIASAKRELEEETGYTVRTILPLGSAAPCTGRLSNLTHVFFIETEDQVAGFTPEPGVTVATLAPGELVALIVQGEFILQLHLGALLLAELRGVLQLPR